MLLLSGYHAREILAGRKSGSSDFEVSLDLGLTKSKVRLLQEGVEFPDRQTIGYNMLERMSRKNSDCFYLQENQAYCIRCYSQASRRFYSLHATGPSTAPTISVSGVRMHQTKNMNPLEDTQAKLDSVSIKGRMLDTCMGLGYTAVYARKKGALEVVTIEKEPVVVEIAKLNPWSRRLFEDPRIRMLEGDSSLLVSTFSNCHFDVVIHDPPRLNLAGALYSLGFYRQLNRVLKPRGQLFHYVGNPGRRYRSKSVVAGVKKRLVDAGFSRVEECRKAQGVRAVKQR